MKVYLPEKITVICLLCCIISSMMPANVHAQEDGNNCVMRVYTYRNSEFMNSDEVYLCYPEISGLEEQKYQEKINTYIQKMAWDDMFGSLLSSYKYWYDTQNFFYGMHKEQNELGEVRVNANIDVRCYGSVCYLYGRILSMNYSGNSYSDGMLSSDGSWETGRGEPFYRILNIDTKSEKEVTLNDILELGDEFFQILENVDISQYNDKAWNISIYESFMKNMNGTDRKEFVKSGKTTRYKWLLDEQGNLEILDKSQDGWQSFKVPLSLFYTIIRPEYKDYANGGLQGYDFSVSSDSDESSVSLNKDIKTASEEPLYFERKSYQYEKDVKLDYFQVMGMSDIVLQEKVNDFILDVTIDAVVNDLSYAYMNNDYYSDENNDKKESMIYIESVLPDYYLNGPILSFTHMEQVTRKAYVAEDGIRKEEIHKEPYLQAFNYDIAQGKELMLGDVFEADDEFFDLIEKREYRNDRWQAGDVAGNYGKSIAYHFNFDMQYYEEKREQFINGEIKYYHWFIDQDEDGNHLCIYRYYALNDEDQCFKIPMSILKDKLKPEYRDCYDPGKE